MAAITGLRAHLVFWILPAAFCGALILLYFSSWEWASALVGGREHREFGLVEMLQNAALVLMLVCVAFGYRRAPNLWGKLGFGAIGCAVLFVLLEETDYGYATPGWWIELLTGLSQGPEGRTVSTIHHIKLSESGDSLRHLFKLVSDTLLGLGFFILPLALHNSRRPLVQYLLPHRLFAASVLMALLMSRFAHYLQNTTAHEGALKGNISEFRELWAYYIFLLYLYFLMQKTGVRQASLDEGQGNDFPVGQTHPSLTERPIPDPPASC